MAALPVTTLTPGLFLMNYGPKREMGHGAGYCFNPGRQLIDGILTGQVFRYVSGIRLQDSAAARQSTRTGDH
mgnify:CR=1 FL=1